MDAKTRAALRAVSRDLVALERAERKAVAAARRLEVSGQKYMAASKTYGLGRVALTHLVKTQPQHGEEA